MFEIEWSRKPGAAQDQLQAIIDELPELVPLIADMLRDMDRFLSRVPLTIGTDNGDGTRQYNIHPVSVRYCVNLDDAVVEILEVILDIASAP